MSKLISLCVPVSVSPVMYTCVCCIGQLLILPVTKSGTSAVTWNNTNGTIEGDNAINASEAVETDGAPMQQKTSSKKTVFSVSKNLNINMH